ncbi:DNA methylase [Kibdelosporangium banguiense]|uniref:DNA methylase n=1 Tax=Kibdelosporangium banguiense TaxID=1365924 RepID=UPI0027DB25FD|nr:DNA methylase [Kibdelosporangium banguiense]
MLLDAFCRKGGAGYGYQAAGFNVVGVDIEDHSNGYPGEFHQGDAVEFIRRHGHEFDVIHASPPCQRETALTKGTNKGRVYPDLIPPTRIELDRTGRPWVMENVQGSQLRKDLVLCGLSFGLRVFRHRVFELSDVIISQPVHPSHRGHRVAGWRHGQYYEGDMVAVYGDGGGKGSLADWQDAMGIPWMTNRLDLAEAIPPAYTEHIGNHIRHGRHGVQGALWTGQEWAA